MVKSSSLRILVAVACLLFVGSPSRAEAATHLAVGSASGVIDHGGERGFPSYCSLDFAYRHPVHLGGAVVNGTGYAEWQCGETTLVRVYLYGTKAGGARVDYVCSGPVSGLRSTFEGFFGLVATCHAGVSGGASFRWQIQFLARGLPDTCYPWRGPVECQRFVAAVNERVPPN